MVPYVFKIILLEPNNLEIPVRYFCSHKENKQRNQKKEEILTVMCKGSRNVYWRMRPTEEGRPLRREGRIPLHPAEASTYESVHKQVHIISNLSEPEDCFTSTGLHTYSETKDSIF